ncbi:unnamed protein product [Ectocarpus sp. 12 AP-2014]
MRSRVLLKDRSCPECKTVQDRLVVAELPASGDAPRFETFNLWGDFAGPDSVFDDESGMVFYGCRGHYDDLLRMRDLYCHVTGCKAAAVGGREGGKGCGVGGHELFPNIGTLMEHMKGFHQRFLCQLCLEGRPLFLSEQEVFTASGLRKHEARVEGGHPLCRFCNKRRFFDNTALYDHMTGTHINCHLCPEENQHRQARIMRRCRFYDSMDSYFRGEPQLRDHLRTSHFLCDRGACRQRGVVSAFNTPSEFQAHLLEDHGITDRRAASTGGVGFNVRRAARDGTGLHTSYNSVADATTPTAPGESLAAPDPELDLAGGVMVPVPSTRGRESTVPSPGTTPALRTRNLPSGGGSAAADPLQEAFPSLPTAPPRSSGGGGAAGAGGDPRQERHALSLVGKNIRPDHQRGGGGRAGGGAPTGSSVSSRGGGGGGHGYEEEEKEKRQLLRNKRLADALGIRAALGAGAAIGGAKVGTTASGAAVAMGIGDGLDAIREHLTRTNYSTYLVSWARANRTELGKLERRLAELVSDPKGTSSQLKPMPSLDRKAAHELAAHYGLVTQSYDLEPKRYVSVIKQKGCRLPSRLLSSAARDPSYTGTDEVPATEGGGAAPALERTTTNPNPRAASLLGPASTPSGRKGSDHPPLEATPSLEGGGGGPRTSTVTSISSADSLAVDPVAAAEAAAAAAAAANNAKADGKKAFFQRSKRRGVPPPSSSARPATATAAPAAKAATILAEPSRQDRDEKDDAAAEEELKGRENINDSVPGKPKKSGSASGSGSLPEAVKSAAAGAPSGDGGRNRGNGAGPGGAEAVGPDNPECLLVFHSVQAGLGGGDAVLASVRTLVPARTVVGVRPATAAEVSAAGVQGHRGGGGSGGSTLVMEFSSALNARRAWEKVEKEAEQLVAAARVTRTDHHAPFRAKLYPSAPPVDDGGGGGGSGGGGGGGLVDVVRDNWDDSSSEEDDEPVDVARDSARDEGEDDETEWKEEPPLQDSHEDEDQAQDQEGKEEKSAPRGTVDDDSTASPGPGASAAAATAAATAAVPTAVAPAAAAAPSSTGTWKRHSKWGNSAIRGRLSRPSDGRATTVEQEAAARQERLEMLRRMEEARRENRQRRDQDRRAERADAGKLEAHAFMWENLGGSSSESSSSGENSDDDGQEQIREAESTEAAAAEAAAAAIAEVASLKAVVESGDSSIPSPVVPEGDGDGDGWPCGVCTFWNSNGTGGERKDADPPRCGVCEAEGPRNACSPWLPA